MKLKEALQSLVKESRTKRLNGVYGAEDLYNRKDFSSFSFANSQIFRGIEGGPAYGYIDPSNFKRKSAHTKNYYTLIIDNSENWSEYPDRSKSIVCTTGQRAASNYGDTYLVIPEGSPSVGIAPARDIWFSFDRKLREINLSTLSVLNEVIHDLSLVILDESPPEKSYSEFKSFIQKLQEVGQEKEEFEHIAKNDTSKNSETYMKTAGSFCRAYTKQDRSLYQFLEYILDPNENAFEVKKYTNPFQVERNLEVWMSSPALLIRKDKWDKFFQKVIGMDTPFKK